MKPIDLPEIVICSLTMHALESFDQQAASTNNGEVSDDRDYSTREGQAHDALEVLNRIEDIFLRLIKSRHQCKVTLASAADKSSLLEMSESARQKNSAGDSDLYGRVTDRDSYRWWSDRRQYSFVDVIYFEANTVHIVLTSFKKIACWPGGDTLIYELRDLLIRISQRIIENEEI